MNSKRQVIIVGAGLSGMSAAHTALEQGARVLVLERNAFGGGNSTKATSGINGAGTKTQAAKNIQDSVELFKKDIFKSATSGGAETPYALGSVLAEDSGPAVDWLMTAFNLDLSLLTRMGGHSANRTHRGKERFPGMTITYGLMEKYEQICKSNPERARQINKARVVDLIQNPNGDCIGVVYETRDGKKHEEYGSVIICTGGFGADFSKEGYLMKYRPDLAHLPTTNGDHCDGSGIRFAQKIGADVVDMTYVQVHPTGIVNPKDPDNKIKFLAAEALRGSGGIMLDANGKRFCNEMGRRDYVSGEMFKGKGPFRLVLNSGSSKEIEWHCKHYNGRGLMKFFKSGAELAKEMNISPSVLEETFKQYSEIAKTNKDPFGKTYFQNAPYEMNDSFNVAIITPVVHYTMGGLKVDEHAHVLGPKGPIRGLYAAGEVMGGVHGKNRLGGNSLLDCVVYGRVSAKTAVKEFDSIKDQSRLGTISQQMTQSKEEKSTTPQADGKKVQNAFS